ncbi:MAG TPA: serine hydrolase domain-containing protein [Polyangia bacterium]
MGKQSRRYLVRKASLAASVSLLLMSGFAAPESLAQQPARSKAAELLSTTGGTERLDAALKELARRDMFSGVVLLAKGDKTVFERAYGLASREYDVPARTDTRFNLASANKMFTAVAIAQLVEQGKVRFDAPISTYLGPDWVAPEIGQKVTVAHLLTHTSGLPDYFNETWPKVQRANYKTLEEFRSLVPAGKLDFEPGTQWRYCNTGFLFLGAIVEKVSGEKYEDYLARAIFKPAGMTRTAIFDLEEVNKDYAQGYGKRPLKPVPQAQGGSRADWPALIKRAATGAEAVERTGFKITNNIYRHVARGGPAGGMFSTAGDMAKFLDAFTSGKLVGPDMVRTMTTPKPLSPVYGYGFETLDNGVGHTGGFLGIATVSIAYPDGYRMVVLSNIDGGSAVAVTKLFELARGAK